MSTQKILLVDDSQEIHVLVNAAIGKKFELKCVSSAAEAISDLKKNSYALILLDVDLPDEDGFKLCANLLVGNKLKNTLIIFLTGKQHTRDKVLAFSLGADDYIVKPFDTVEFQARIESKMRRLSSNDQERDNYTQGLFRINLPQQKVFVTVDGNEGDVEFSSIEFKIFYYLIRHEDQILSRQQILDEVWGNEKHVFDRNVDSQIYTLRRKLGTLGKCIQSVSRMGYKLSQSQLKAIKPA